MLIKALTLLLSGGAFFIGCASHPPTVPDLWGDPLCAFAQIGFDPAEHAHDCDDMAQEFRDHLVASGIDPVRIRLCMGTPIEGDAHCWVEVHDLAGAWWAFDPRNGIYSEAQANYRARWNFERVDEMPGMTILIDPGGGYEGYGDRWFRGVWHRE